MGRPFVGKAGKNLDHFLALVGLVRGEIYITNVVKFRPTKTGATGRLSNRPPTREEIALFRPWLMAEIARVNPGVIATLGNVRSGVTGQPDHHRRGTRPTDDSGRNPEGRSFRCITRRA